MNVDGFRTTDSFRFSSSSVSSSASRTSYSSKDFTNGLKKFVQQKLTRHRSSVSLNSNISRYSSPPIYDDAWNLEKQIEQLDISSTEQSSSKKFNWADEQQILSAAPWYQEGLSISICEDYLLDEDQPEGAFIIHRSFHQDRWILVLSVKTNEKTVFHYPIEKQLGYRLKDGSKMFFNLSNLVIHHTVIKENLPVLLVLSRPNHTSIIRSVRF